LFCLRAESRVSARDDVVCVVAATLTPDTRAAAAERRAAAQRATLRNARACTALRYSQRASARR